VVVKTAAERWVAAFALSATENRVAIGQDASRGAIYRIASWKAALRSVVFSLCKNNGGFAIYLGTRSLV
jgi:hypothetical protein